MCMHISHDKYRVLCNSYSNSTFIGRPKKILTCTQELLQICPRVLFIFRATFALSLPPYIPQEANKKNLEPPKPDQAPDCS